jgi:hypothetical protein
MQSNFSRFDEFQLKLNAVRAYFEGKLIHNNDAVIVKSDTRQSIGVTRLLTNYYRPSAEESARLSSAADVGKERSFAAFRHSIDNESFAKNFSTLVDEERYQSYDSAMTVDDALFARQQLVPIGSKEYALGSPSVVAREQPRHDADYKHVTGSIDRLRYNTRTGRLALIELKSGQTRAPYMKMRSLYLKEKHCKQLTLYAYLLLIMAAEASVAIAPQDLELIIVGWDTCKHTLSVWKMNYDPQTFLGSRWAASHWYGLLDTGFMARRTLDRLCCIPQCGQRAIYSSARRDLLYCSVACRNKPHCACGQPAFFRAKSGAFLCRACTKQGGSV